MALQERALALAAGRIGLGDEPKVIRKASELVRLLQTRLMAGGVINESCRNVLCLELAAQALGVPVDNVSVVKQSGLKKAAYLSSRSTVERLLEINAAPTVAAVSLQQQCVSAQGLAESILAAYQKVQEVDLSNPQYVSMAVYQACRISKMKVSKSKLISSSRLKPAQWARLEAEWTRFVDQQFVPGQTVKGAGSETLLAKLNDDVEMPEEVSPKSDKPKAKIEDYESWRKRILEESYRELRELARETTPRKSPRKRVDTPPKSCGTPSKLDRSKGVRLLF